MNYIDSTITSGETVIYRAKLTKWIFLPGILWLIIITPICNLINATFGKYILIFTILILFSEFINYITSEFGLTNERIIVKTGFIRRNAFELLLKKVEGVQVDQGITARIFRYGNIIIIGTGGSRNSAVKISEPMAYKKIIQEQLERNPERII
jgi:uncharacterized membrane protein YdbT with pleckstrin-like domain